MSEKYNSNSAHYDTSAEDKYKSFNVDTTDLGRDITLTSVAIESRPEFRDELPNDWQEQLTAHIEQTDLVIPEYFMPEIEPSLDTTSVLGAIAAKYSSSHHDVYRHVANAAAESDKQVAAMDIANKPAFMAYELFPQVALMHTISRITGRGVAGREANTTERIVPTHTDARRMFTAAGIRQESERWPDGGRFLYIAAPAHVNRVKDYLTREPNTLDTARFATYRHSMPILDRAVRTYQYDTNEAAWQLVGRDPIGKQL